VVLLIFYWSSLVKSHIFFLSHGDCSSYIKVLCSADVIPGVDGVLDGHCAWTLSRSLYRSPSTTMVWILLDKPLNKCFPNLSSGPSTRPDFADHRGGKED
uniref:Uncharacterized protein n=1 Tax=Leptobrachium leishanense TaxID=445787 RepID=A0A8C5LRJ6_9ANUR